METPNITDITEYKSKNEKSKQKEEKGYIRTKKLAKLLDIPESTVRKLARTKVIPAYKLTNDYHFDYDEIKELMKKKKVH